MTDTANTGFFRGVPNGRHRVEGETGLARCPTCDRPFADDEQAKRVYAKHEAQQRALADAYKRREADAHNAGVEAGKAARQEEIDALGQNMEAAINERVDQRVAAVEANRQSEARQHFDQNQKMQSQVVTLQQKILKLQQELEQKTSNQKGDMGEVDLFRLLKEAFVEDKITRVDKGVEGADVIFAAIDNGKVAGKVILENKNTTGNFLHAWCTKLHQDQLKVEADYAILVTNVFPSEQRDEPYFTENNVIVVTSDLVVPVTRLLRDFLVKLSRARIGTKDHDVKKAKMFDFFDSGQGRTLLRSAVEDIRTLRDLDETLVRQAKKHQKDSGKVLDQQAGKLADISHAIDDIISGEDDGKA